MWRKSWRCREGGRSVLNCELARGWKPRFSRVMYHFVHSPPLEDICGYFAINPAPWLECVALGKI